MNVSAHASSSPPLPPSRLAVRFPTAFVTGASGGLGLAFAERLLRAGVRVWGTARDVSRLRPLANHPGFTAVALDLAEGDAAEKAFLAAADDAGGAFDLLINNAGYGCFTPFAAAEFDVWSRQLDAMVTTSLRLTHLALRRLQGRDPLRGGIVNVSSLATEFPLPCMSGYNVAKAGLSAFSESLIFEMRGTDVIVIDFRPGDYRTAFNQSMSATALSTRQPHLTAIWRRLEHNLNTSPLPVRAARDLECALLKGKSGTVRSGSVFQAVIAPLLARLAPLSLKRVVMARYFGAP